VAGQGQGQATHSRNCMQYRRVRIAPVEHQPTNTHQIPSTYLVSRSSSSARTML
jgi:hypothetical protein